MINIARACSAGNEIVRCISVESHILYSLGEWQSLLVLHQDHTFGSRLASYGCMSLQIGFVAELISLETRTFLNKIQNTTYAAVEVGLGKFSALHASHDTVELLFFSGLKHIVSSPHLLGAVFSAKPVGHHRAFVAPFIAQNGFYKVFTFRRIRSVDVVI